MPKDMCAIQLKSSSQDGKAEDLNTELIHPFWAVLKCPNVKSVHNMQLSMEDFVVPKQWCKIDGAQKPVVQTVVTLPVLRNILPIEKDDVLTVALRVDEENK